MDMIVQRQMFSVLLKRVARAARFALSMASGRVLVRLLPIISHAVKRFLGMMCPITCCILLDRTSRCGHDLGVWSHCYRRASYPTLVLHTPIHPQAKDRPGQSRGESAQVRMPSQRLVGRRACRHIHNRSSSSSSPCSLAKVLPEPLHAAVRVTNFAQRRYAHIHSDTAYAYTHTTHEQRCGSTCRFLD